MHFFFFSTRTLLFQEGTELCIGKIRVREASDEAEAIENLLRNGEVADAFSLKKTFNLADANQRPEERVVYTGGMDRKTMNVIAIVVIFSTLGTVVVALVIWRLKRS